LKIRVCKLGFVKVRFDVCNPLAPEKVVELDGVVDTGAMYSVIPRKLLEELKVKPLERRRFRAFGGYVKRGVAEIGVGRQFLNS